MSSWCCVQCCSAVLRIYLQTNTWAMFMRLVPGVTVNPIRIWAYLCRHLFLLVSRPFLTNCSVSILILPFFISLTLTSIFPSAHHESPLPHYTSELLSWVALLRKQASSWSSIRKSSLKHEAKYWSLLQPPTPSVQYINEVQIYITSYLKAVITTTINHI